MKTNPKQTTLKILLPFFILVFAYGATPSIKLPPPDTTSGKPLMQALKDRKSDRLFSQKKLSQKHLSEILWAAGGINRENGKRTAPSALNRQTIDTYAVLEEGIYLYDPKNHELKLQIEGDHRSLTGTQEFVATAPLNIIYIADLNRLENLPFPADPQTKETWTCLDAGHNSQNAYLYAASENLSIVTRGSINKEELSKTMNLSPKQKIVLAQTVGYKN